MNLAKTILFDPYCWLAIMFIIVVSNKWILPKLTWKTLFKFLFKVAIWPIKAAYQAAKKEWEDVEKTEQK